jgi:hypothetical protein
LLITGPETEKGEKKKAARTQKALRRRGASFARSLRSSWPDHQIETGRNKQRSIETHGSSPVTVKIIGTARTYSPSDLIQI